MPHQCIECSRTFADGSKQMLAGCPDCGGNKFQFRPKSSVSVEDTQTQSEPLTPAQSAKQTKSSKAGDAGKTRTTTLREWAKKKVTPGSSTTETAVATSAGSGSAQASKPARSRSQSASTEAQRSTATELDSFGDESVQDESGRDDVSPNDAETVPDLDHEDSAQADARRGLVGADELPDPPAADDNLRQQTDPRQRNVPPQRDNSNIPDGSDSHQPDAPSQPDGSHPDDSHNDESDQPDDQEPRPDLAQLREELNDQFESIKVVEPGQYELNLMELYDREEYIIALQENGRYVIEVPDAWDATE